MWHLSRECAVCGVLLVASWVLMGRKCIQMPSSSFLPLRITCHVYSLLGVLSIAKNSSALAPVSYSVVIIVPSVCATRERARVRKSAPQTQKPISSSDKVGVGDMNGVHGET